MEKKHTILTVEQKQLLEELYHDANRAVDDLPYTGEMEQLHQSFVSQTNLPLTIREVYKALKNMGRDGRLGGKYRQKSAA